MRKTALSIGALALLSVGGFVGAQTASSSRVIGASTPTQTTVATTQSAAQLDPGTKMRLAVMDTSASAFRKLDEDNDGRISALEAANSPHVAAAFTMADKDKDGYLSKEEFEALNPTSSASARDLDASSPSGDRATEPTGDHASNPSGDQAATGPNEPSPTDNSPSPRRVAHPRR